MSTFFAAHLQYGKAAAAPDNTTIMVTVTLTVRYPQPAMVPSEQAAIAAIYNECASLAYAIYNNVDPSASHDGCHADCPLSGAGNSLTSACCTEEVIAGSR